MQTLRSHAFLALNLLLAGGLSVAFLAGCPDNSATSAGPANTTTATTSAPTMSSSAPTASASAAPDTGDSGSADDSGASAAAATDAATNKPDAATLACGTKPLPDCPMQAWMKANTSAAMQSKNFPALATALDQVVKMQPPGYAGWAQIAADGAKAARAQDADAVKASCKTCHGQFQKRFQADTALRPRKI